MRRMSVILFVAAGLAGAGLASFLALSVGEHGGGANAAPITPRSTPVLPVPTVAVVKKTVPLYLDYVGMTEPLRTVTLQAKVTGYLAVQAALETAQLNLGYTEIRAPFTGRLSRSSVHEGTLISAAGTQLNTLVQLDPIYATFNPAETDLAAIDKARAKGPVPVEIRTNDEGPLQLRGTLAFIDNAVDRGTGTIAARAMIPNHDLTLLPGQYIRARVNIGDRPDARLVPQAAIGTNQIGEI